MKKIIACFLIFLIPVVFLQSKKLVDLKDSYKAPAGIIDNKHLCIWDQSLRKIRVFTLWDFKKVSEFGRKGQAPGEFQAISSVYFKDDCIIVNSYPKICFFSKKGKLFKEIKFQTNVGNFIPFGKNFIGISYPYTKPKEEKSKVMYSLFDSRLNKKREIFLSEIKKYSMPGKTKEILYMINDRTKAVVSNDRLYIGSTERGFYFSVFDQNGNNLYEINKNYEKIKITEEDKKRKLDEFKKSWGEVTWRQYNSIYELRVRDYYPAYANFCVDNGKIYVFKYPGEKSQDIIILDIKGNLLKNKTIPSIKTPGVISHGRFIIKDGLFYYIKDNAETEKWEFHVLHID